MRSAVWLCCCGLFVKYILRKQNRAGILKSLTDYLCSLDAEKEYQVTIGLFKNSRSIAQNAALFGMAYVLLSEHTGITKDDLHEYYCMKHFGTVCRVVFGRKKWVPFRTTTTDEHGNKDVISTVEFNKFWEFVVGEAAKLGCYIPDPQKDILTQPGE